MQTSSTPSRPFPPVHPATKHTGRRKYRAPVAFARGAVGSCRRTRFLDSATRRMCGQGGEAGSLISRPAGLGTSSSVGGSPPSSGRWISRRPSQPLSARCSRRRWRIPRSDALNLWDHYGLTAAPKQSLKENDFDFTLKTNRQGVSRRLFLSRGRTATSKLGGPIMGSVLLTSMVSGGGCRLWGHSGKVERYGAQPRSAIHLMMYATDFRLSIGRELLDLLSLMTSG